MAESAVPSDVRPGRVISARPARLHVLRDPARLLFVVGTSGLLAIGVVGLPLAIAGVFVPLIAIPAITLVCVPLAIYGWRITLPTREPGTASSVAAVLVVLAFGTFAGLHSSQHLLTDRDPGVYFVTAGWVAEHGTLLYDTGLTDELVGSLDDLESRSSPGIYAGPDGASYFQFQHLPALSFAVAHWLGDDGLMFRFIALVASIAQLGIFLVARKLVGPRLALIPLIVAIVHPAFLHFAKDAYSEWFAITFAFAAFLVWLETRYPGDRWSYLAVGSLLGAGTLTRIDAWLTATAFMAGLLYMRFTTRNRELSGYRMTYFMGGLIAVASIGAFDLVLRSPEYLSDLKDVATPLLLAFATIGFALLITPHIAPKPGPWLETVRRLAPPALAVLVVVGGLYGLFLRPHLGQVRTDEPNPGVPAFQEAEGLALDPYRTYAESSLEWLARYQGYLPVTFAILAAGLAVYVMLRKRGDPRVPLLVTYIAVGVLYLWRPSITPDHLWALRRFLPIVLPLSFIFATWAGRYLLRRYPGSRYLAPALLIVLGGAVTQSVITGWPIANVRTQVGVLEAIEDLCDSLPPDSVVLLDEGPGLRRTGALRTKCDVPVTRLGEPGIVADVIEAGLLPVGVTLRPTCGVDLGEIDRLYELPERTLTAIPNESERGRFIAHLTLLGGENTRSLATIPETASHALQVEVATTSTPDSGSSIIASMGPYLEGMWLEYRPDGTAELWMATTDGPVVIPFPDPIDDGEPRSIGGYVIDNVLYAICGEQVVEEIVFTGLPVFADQELRVREVAGTEAANVAFQGEIRFLQTRPALEGP
jgi:hypothetical protein